MKRNRTFSGLDRPKTREILRRFACGESQAAIAEDLGMFRPSVTAICRKYADHVRALMDARDRAAIEAATALELLDLGVDLRR